jgi:hypothetical protein
VSVVGCKYLPSKAQLLILRVPDEILRFLAHLGHLFLMVSGDSFIRATQNRRRSLNFKKHSGGMSIDELSGDAEPQHQKFSLSAILYRATAK